MLALNSRSLPVTSIGMMVFGFYLKELLTCVLSVKSLSFGFVLAPPTVTVIQLPMDSGAMGAQILTIQFF